MQVHMKIRSGRVLASTVGATSLNEHLTDLNCHMSSLPFCSMYVPCVRCTYTSIITLYECIGCRGMDKVGERTKYEDMI